MRLKLWAILSAHVFVACIACGFYGLSALGFGVIFNPESGAMFLGGALGRPPVPDA